jgi:hypothetical protein
VAGALHYELLAEKSASEAAVNSIAYLIVELGKTDAEQALEHEFFAESHWPLKLSVGWGQIAGAPPRSRP